MQTTHSSLGIANRILELATRRGDSITPLQLIKLVYLSHGFMLGLYGRPLVAESAQAWTYGPVFPELYRAVKQFRSHPVRAPLPAPPEVFDALEDDVIRQVYEKYGQRSGVSLSRLTHQPRSPWSWVWHEGKGHGSTISNDLLEDYYARLASQ